jgi:hypothetical protein
MKKTILILCACGHILLIKGQESKDIHLADAVNLTKGKTVNLQSEDSYLFLDNVRPSVVIEKYANSILISGKPLKIGKGGNARVEIYKQGSVVIPHGEDYQPLQTFTEKEFKGISESFSTGNYYTGKAIDDMPASLIRPLAQDNAIQSFKLKRGYMATFATEPDGMGYSRVFIADSADIELSFLPVELEKKISYIRVFKWRWPSKKGWCGVYDKKWMVQSNGTIKQENELNLTQSTWEYSWGASDPYYTDCEFVPMKWGLRGSYDIINSRTDISHLLGFNEPNRPDQSNMSVEEALDEWPKLMRSGLRLGSPSVSDNSRLEDWLYKFIDECKKRNYRVDYVTVHGYWGPDQMREPENWLKTLREIHLRTGLPIWLTEWNIGANWTKEPWPSEEKAQYAKQLANLKGILEILDNAPFVERYSIYNWVENKRAMIVDSFSYKDENGKKVKEKLLDQKITPAGEFYRDNHPGLAFNSQNEVVPVWKMIHAPKLTYELSERNEIELFWDLAYPAEMIGGYAVERSLDNEHFLEIKHIDSQSQRLFFEALMDKKDVPNETVYYRIQLLDLYGKKCLTSNIVSYSYIKNQAVMPVVGNLTNNTKWSMYTFENAYEKEPVLLFGVPTNRNKAPQTFRAKNLSASSFDFKLDTWEYLQDPEFANNDTIAFMALPSEGAFNYNGFTAEAGKITGVTSDYTEVRFKTPFKETPVVFVSQITNRCDSTTSVRIREVTKDGFFVHLQYEAGVTPPSTEEEVCYVAVTPGKGSIKGFNVEVGRTEGDTAGEFFNPETISYAQSYKQPAVFGTMQTENDDIASGLRIKKQGNNFVEFFKEKEKSKSVKPASKETVGWMIIETKK